MVTPGTFSTLSISKILDFGIYLDGGESGDILLPMKWVPDNCKPNDQLRVFIYNDSSNRLIATTMIPHAILGDFAYLKANAVNPVGAFMDWGLEKDLLVPYREQKYKIEEANWYVVYIFADEKGRVAGSTHLEKFIDADTSALTTGEEVDLLLYAASDLGFKAIVNNRYEGIIYANEVFQPLKQGLKTKGIIKNIRPDGKLDLSLYKLGYGNKIDDLSTKILEHLQLNQGYMPLTDRSSAEEIYLALGMSKKNFKKTIGNLYKQKLIILTEEGIKLVSKESQGMP